jgi:CYTH domain-containing protein
MAQEIEKKYLIQEKGKEYLAPALFFLYPSIQALKEDVFQNGKLIRQGYLLFGSGLELSNKIGMHVDFAPNEFRLRDKSGALSFTIKGRGELSRNELESEIKRNIFDKYWSRTEGKRVEKVRLDKPFEGHTAEIDVYTDRDLIVAEVEFPTLQDAEIISSMGKDITNDKKYKNKNLAK